MRVEKLLPSHESWFPPSFEISGRAGVNMEAKRGKNEVTF